MSATDVATTLLDHNLLSAGKLNAHNGPSKEETDRHFKMTTWLTQARAADALQPSFLAPPAGCARVYQQRPLPVGDPNGVHSTAQANYKTGFTGVSLQVELCLCATQTVYAQTQDNQTATPSRHHQASMCMTQTVYKTHTCKTAPALQIRSSWSAGVHDAVKYKRQPRGST